MEKIGLVIEGGGLRGAYTAGALCWLLDHDITFDYGVGISIGALYLSAYMSQNKALLKEYSINLAGSKNNVGIVPLLKEGTLVGYDNMFRQVVENDCHIDIDVLNANPVRSEIGVYDLSSCETVWISNDQIDAESLYIKAACTLPMFGRKVHVNGIDYLDGGITTMIPINRSIINNNTKHFVITTKPENYVRKPYSKLVLWLFKVVYRKYPKLAKDIAKRDKAYYDELNKIKDLVNNQEAIHVYPSADSGVTRFSGSIEQLQQLFDLGYNDMEKRKAEIFAFMNKE